MKLDISNAIKSNHRLHIEKPSANQDPSAEITLKAVKVASPFKRLAKNIFTFGYHTKYVVNPNEWKAFKNAIAADIQKTSGGHVNEEDALAMADVALSGFNPHKRLTAAKINTALANLSDIKAGRTLELREPKRLNASQSLIARAVQTSYQKLRTLTQEERQIKNEAKELLDLHEQQTKIFLEGKNFAVDSILDEEELVEAKPSKAEANVEPELIDANDKSEADQVSPTQAEAARSVLNILRPGNQINGGSINSGQQALASYAQKMGNQFSYVPVDPTTTNTPIKARVNEAIAHHIAHRNDINANAEAPNILAIPLNLHANGLGENHSVLLAVDYRSRKVLYLDAKGHSIENAMKSFSNTVEMKAELERLGTAIFGEDWNPSTDILQMTQAKQQGANDCVAFTHDFTRRLIEGQSVGDIERTFVKSDRQKLRLEMAQDIQKHLIRPNNEPIQKPAIGGASLTYFEDQVVKTEFQIQSFCENGKELQSMLDLVSAEIDTTPWRVKDSAHINVYTELFKTWASLSTMHGRKPLDMAAAKEKALHLMRKVAKLPPDTLTALIASRKTMDRSFVALRTTWISHISKLQTGSVEEKQIAINDLRECMMNFNAECESRLAPIFGTAELEAFELMWTGAIDRTFNTQQAENTEHLYQGIQTYADKYHYPGADAFGGSNDDVRLNARFYNVTASWVMTYKNNLDLSFWLSS